MLNRARISSTPPKVLATEKRSMRARINRDYKNLEAVVCIENTNPFCFDKHCLNCHFPSLLGNCRNRHFNDLVFKCRLKLAKLFYFAFKMKLLHSNIGSSNPYLNSLNGIKRLLNDLVTKAFNENKSQLYHKKANKTLDIGNKGGVLC